MPEQTIDSATLAHLVEAGAVQEARVIGRGSGWSVVVRCGHTERSLAAHRGSVRVFRRFETMVAYLKTIGLAHYSVDAQDYDPAQKSDRKRPDSAARLRRTHEAAEYDAWFRAEVQKALDEADKPDAVFIPHDVVMADLRGELESIAARAGKDA